MAIKNIIAQDQYRRTTIQKCATDQAGLRDFHGSGLSRIMQGLSPLFSSARQSLEARHILFGRDNRDRAHLACISVAGG
jgi:hypothetical protein